MKRTFEFKADEEKYTLSNTNPNEKQGSFEIKKQEMQFNTKEFYQYVFSDIVVGMEVEILDRSDPDDKAAKRVYKVISEIANGVMKKMNEKCFGDM
jgi:hypothetical protein